MTAECTQAAIYNPTTDSPDKPFHKTIQRVLQHWFLLMTLRLLRSFLFGFLPSQKKKSLLTKWRKKKQQQHEKQMFQFPPASVEHPSVSHGGGGGRVNPVELSFSRGGEGGTGLFRFNFGFKTSFSNSARLHVVYPFEPFVCVMPLKNPAGGGGLYWTLST